MEDRQLPVGILVRARHRAHEMGSQWARRDLQRQPTPFDGVVVADPALFLEAQDARRNRFCQRLAASMVTIPAKASSLGRRSWRVRKARSERPRASGEYAAMWRMPSWAKARPPECAPSSRPPRRRWGYQNNGCPGRCRARKTARAGRSPRRCRESSRACLLPRPERPNRSHSSHHRALPPGRIGQPGRAAGQSARRLDAASSPATLVGAAGGDAPSALAPAAPTPLPARRPPARWLADPPVDQP